MIPRLPTSLAMGAGSTKLPAVAGRRRPGDRDAGFSLLEMMVAAGLLVVIILGLLAMFFQTERAFRLGVQQTDVLVGGRSAMDMIAQDMQAMKPWGLYEVTNFWFEFQIDPLTFAKQTLPGNERRTNILEEFYFLTRHNDEWKGIRYGFNPEDAKLGVATLYRMERSFFMTNALTLDANLVDFYRDEIAEGTYTRVPDDYGRLIEGVVHMKLKVYDKFGNLLVDEYNLPVGGTTNFFYTNLPASVDLELGVLEPKALERFQSMKDNPGFAANYLDRQAGRVHLFRQRISIRSAP